MTVTLVIDDWRGYDKKRRGTRERRTAHHMVFAREDLRAGAHDREP